MAELINLNRARKARARHVDQAAAAENRARHGRTGAEKARDRAEAVALAATLDGARRDPPPE